MNRKHNLVCMVVLPVALFGILPGAVADTAVSIQTPNKNFGSTEPVIIEIKNIGDKVIPISSSAPWYIIRSRDNAGDAECSGSVVYSGGSATRPLRRLLPRTGQAETWRWDQLDDENNPVAAGEYCVVFDEPLKHSFTILPDAVSPVTVTLSTDGGFFRSGASRTLAWSSKNADSCSTGWSTKTTTSGSEVVFPPNRNTTYDITCINSAYSAMASVTLLYLAGSATTQTPWFKYLKGLSSNEAFYPNRKGTYGYKFTVRANGTIIELGMDSSETGKNCGTVYL